MLTLGIDSTALTASAALVSDGTVLASLSSTNRLTHSERLLPLIESLLALAETDLSKVDAFAVAAGPGSFTGVRIGVSVCKGLAFGTEKPCVGISTLEALAFSLSDAPGALLCPLMDARRGEFYNALFLTDKEGMKRSAPDRAISGETLAEELKTATTPVLLSGDGAALFYQDHACKNFTLVNAAVRLQNAASVALLGENAVLNGSAVDASSLVVHYVRASGAQRKLGKEMDEC